MATFASPHRQLFSIPYNYILYMLENPTTPEVLQKLYATCKFFLSRNPILISPHVECEKAGIIIKHLSKNVKIDTTAKLWPTSTLIISVPLDINKFYRFSPTFLVLRNITLSMVEFELLVAENTIEKAHFINATIMNASVDMILGKLPNAIDFFYDHPSEKYSIETLQNLANLERIKKFKKCSLQISHVFPTFSFPDFCLFVEQYGDAHSRFVLGLPPDAVIVIDSERYKTLSKCGKKTASKFTLSCSEFFGPGN